MANYRNKKLTQSAKHESCVSCGNLECCWCHSNEIQHGKGKGLKSNDLFGFYGCLHCHNWYDGRSDIAPPSSTRFDDKKSWFRKMWEYSMVIATEKGYL
jgi:hypothetical protein